MRQQTSKAIILRRTHYGEADRIVTFLTPVGKIKAMVKGVRRSKSKLAGGIELFSESTITFLETRGDLQRIVSTRLEQHWDGIVGDLPRMMFGYEAMKLMDKIIEADAEPDYYELLKEVLVGLNHSAWSVATIEVWFYLRLLRLLGHEPNLKTDHVGTKLVGEQLYSFSADDMCFSVNPGGNFRSDHIKFLRLALANNLEILKNIKDVTTIAGDLQPLFKNLIRLQLG